MARWISAATWGAAVFSVTLAAAPTSSAQGPAQQSKTQATQSNKSNSSSAPRAATLSGCVVRDAANGGQPTIASNGISYTLTGRPAAEFAGYLGKRLEVTGILTAGAADARGTTGVSKSGASTVPKGLTATAGQSDVTATGVSRDNTLPADRTTARLTSADGAIRQTAPVEPVPLATDHGTTADLTGQMQVKTVRVVSPNCL